MAATTFDEILEAIDHLPTDTQADLLEVARRRLAQRGRQRVVEETASAWTEFMGGQATRTTADDLMREIQS